MHPRVARVGRRDGKGVELGAEQGGAGQRPSAPIWARGVLVLPGHPGELVPGAAVQ